MTSCSPQRAKQLPRAYLKFYKEWKAAPTAIHCIPKEGKFQRDVDTVTNSVQTVLMPVRNPFQQNNSVEGTVKGFQKRKTTEKRTWSELRRNVLHSVILNKHWSTLVTERTMNLINESYGLDHYLLKTPACDLQSTLAFRIKRQMLQALKNDCPDVDAEERTQILEEYSKYAEQYTPEEIEWYGYTFKQALDKHLSEEKERRNAADKIEFRSRLIEQLRRAGIAEAVIAEETASADSKEIGDSSTWFSNMNPFVKKPET